MLQSLVEIVIRRLGTILDMFYRRYRQSISNMDRAGDGWFQNQGYTTSAQCVTIMDVPSKSNKKSILQAVPVQERTNGKKKRKKTTMKQRKSIDVLHSAPLIPFERNLSSLSDSSLIQKPSKKKSNKLQVQALLSPERINELSATPIRHQMLPLDKTETKKKLPLLVAIKPVNEKSERERFMRASFNYNPYFAYRGYAEDIEKFKEPSDKYIHQAVLIMERAIEEFGCYEAFEEETGGKILSKSQIYNLVKKYLSNEELEEEIVVNLRDDLLSRGSMTRSKGKAVLNVRCVNLRENWAEGLLRHEIGTHYLRSCNTRHQPWQSNRVRRELGMGPINPTEEGLASLHSVLMRDKPYLWRAALLYYTTLMAAKLSFKELFHNLGQYVHNPEVRWDYCLRAKRGQVDTSRPGSFCKDQVYLEGALQLLKRRRVLDFHLLVRLGKVSWEDVDRESVSEIAQLDKTRIPWFMDNLTAYRRNLDWIAKTNGLTDAVLSSVD